MKSYVKFVMGHRLQMAIVLFLMLIFSIVGITKVELSRDFKVFVPNESRYNDMLDEMNDDFPSKDQLIIMISYDNEVMDKMTYESLVLVNEHISTEYDDIRVAGPVSEESIDAIDEESIDAYNERLELLGALSPTVIKEGKAHYIFSLFSEKKFEKNDLDQLENFLETGDFDYALSGDSYVQLKVFDYIRLILIKVPPIAVVVLLLAFYFKLRTIKGTLLSIFPAVISSILTMGIIGYMGNEVSIITVLAPVFTLVIGSADGLHFVTHIQEEQRSGKSTGEVLTRTLSMIGIPMIITTITSIIGFLALMVMDTAEIITFAIFASLGVFLAGAVTWYLLPLMLAGGMQLGYRGKILNDKDGILRKFWGKKALIIVAIVAGVFLLGAGNVSQEFNMFRIYRENTQVYQNTKFINDINGGSLPVFIYGDLSTEQDEATMVDEVLLYEDGLRDIEHVGKVMSAADMLKIFGGDRELAVDNLDLIGEFVNLGAGKFRIMVLPTNYDNAVLRSIQSYVDEMQNDFGHYNFKVTGASYIMYELNENMIQNQIYSSLIAIFFVFILLLVSLRHLRAAIISTIPIILTLLFLFGMMGIIGISLNIVSCTIFSITIGVGIDYAIHFTSIWRTKKKQGLSSKDSTDFAFRYAARPILANAFGLSLGFSALLISPLQFHVTVAILMWIAMISSVVFSLIILPTMLRKI